MDGTVLTNHPQEYMMRVLQLAERGRGRTSPNPMVGAVIVKDGQIVGEGYHPKAGQPHAEIFALRAAGEKARGGTLYVNLEPCCHYGRTPPCTQAIIRAGISEVHFSMLDPNPQVAGKGAAELEAAGIRTVIGERQEQAHELNEVFIHWMATGMPFVVAKFGMSLDGKIATRTGDSRWITNTESRTYTHTLRDQLDAILVGADTVIIDDPMLTTRLDKDDVKHPLRIVLDSKGRIPIDARILDSALPGKTIVASTEVVAVERRQALAEKGIELLVCPEDDGRVDIKSLLVKLGSRQITSLLVEGGGTMMASFLEKGLVNKMLSIIAPLIIGGDAPTPVGGLGVDRLADAWRLTRLDVRQFGTDVLVSGYPVQQES
ncbi:MAG: bifunctional diaminohydroxyphosphoribosylaminopyrimidine deaminase/5-amino-6-(5-phosphoribosylamino)uracil reductase RibD [Anaerolineales bacterium]|nr:bifunctional diaminohydroxyphosphoribosylaminopyrimidine deaminase/5-amino-6-(5-phosphoribosylamino)uracil reductase RibD [Anaerolineales bacterium]